MQIKLFPKQSTVKVRRYGEKSISKEHFLMTKIQEK